MGSHLISRLLHRGHSILALGRNPEALRNRLSIYGDQNANIETFAWDAFSKIQNSKPLPSIDAVIHLAGEPIFGFRWSEEKKTKIRESRVQGTRSLAQLLASQATPPKVMISTSAIGFYGSRGDESLTEESSRGSGFLADVCEAWENEAKKIKADRTCIFRIGIVLGDSGGALKTMLTPFRLGLGGRIGSGKQWMSWIHLDDLTQMIAEAIEKDSWSGVINAVSPHPVQNAEFTQTLARTLHRPAPFPVPAFALKMALGEMADETVLTSQNVVPRRAESLGYSFLFKNLEGALKNILPDRT